MNRSRTILQSAVAKKKAPKRPKRVLIKTDAPEDHRPVVSIYIDGACKGNHQKNVNNRRAGYGIWFGPDDDRNVGGRLPGIPTNNRSELYSLIKLFELLKTHNPDKSQFFYKIHTDSTYTIDVVRGVDKWFRDGWKNASRKTPTNLDLVKQYHKDKEGFHFQVIHVDAHSGIEGNECADKLANQGCYLEEEPKPN